MSLKMLLRLGYCGTNYHGFQVQPNAVTVQEKLQDAVQSLYGGRFPVTGCSRTDSGVHAKEFYCTVDIDENSPAIPYDRVPLALNHFLPDDISVYDARPVDSSFHPRYNALGKEYIYVIWNSRISNPFLARRVYHYPRKLDADLMNEAAQHFKGTHDFYGFMASGSDIEDTVREIKYADVKCENDKVIFTVAANGFLYNMVRIITGTLIFVSENKIGIDLIDEVIESRDRSRAGPTVPPDGLYLNRVVYDKWE